LDQEAVNFFQEKKSWSKYKDLILDYYLAPYLAKVSHLRRPILIVDCFAGPGRFDDGELGSPLIISNHLTKCAHNGIQVKGYFIEREEELFLRLKANIKENTFPTIARNGPFQDYIGELSELAKTHTVFVYVDPIKPSQLSFEDLNAVYEQLEKSNQSIETLINFLSFGFLRAIEGVKEYIVHAEEVQSDHPITLKWNNIAGGDYWYNILCSEISSEQKVESLAKGYSEALRRWFKYILSYPVRENYEDALPKYHLMFCSRHPDAVELINRAMVKARRDFVGVKFVKGMLFENQPKEEVVDEEEIKTILLSILEKLEITTWKLLRFNATLAHPSMYTDSEFNRNIKILIQKQKIKSNCKGTKIEEDANVWL
jgi:three-Cys-motif partner protein